MSILIKSEKVYYEIPNDVLEKCKISKEQFEKGLSELSADVARQKRISWDSDCTLVDLTSCCMTKQSLWASCLPPK